jgi:PAS domain S-box-containing protein
MWMEKLKRNENIIIPSIPDLPNSWVAEREILEPQGIQSLVVIPMFLDQRPIGFVGLDSVFNKKQYTIAEINILKVWGNLLTSLINHKKKEEIIEQTRKNYETFFNTIDDFLFVLDTQGNIIHTNTTVTNRLQYTSEELLSKSVLQVHPPERREEAGRIVGEMLAGSADFCPVPLVTKSGEYIPVETRVKAGFWDGKPVIFGVTKDVSKIKLSEEKFSKAFQSNSAMMAITGFVDGVFIDVNETMVRTLGYEHNELIGKRISDIKIFDDPVLRHTITGSLRQNVPVREIEMVAHTKSGAPIIGLFSADVIYIGKDRCVLTMIVDITERKKAEEDLKKARKEADLANVAKSEFLSRMSHELRTPMNSILGFAQLLQMGVLNPRQKTGVGHILNSGKHLLNLINEVLDISRIEAGKISLSMEPIQVFGIIREMMDIVNPNSLEKQQTLEFSDSPANYLFLIADSKRLKQVLLNLINNAIKYNCSKGKVTIKTESLPSEPSGASRIRISVTDTGWGISADDLPKLFKPFERIGAEKTETEGTGLGLAVVKKLMDAMAGTIGVESTVGVGSTFWIEFPQSASPLEIAENSGGVLDMPSELDNKSGTILYIEDNVSNIELVDQILSVERPGIHLISNKNGRLAVPLAIENKPDLILLDLDLPDIHGTEVLMLLQNEVKTGKIPVVIISADAMPKQIEKLMNSGAKNYLTKPLDIALFLKTIDKWVGK